MFDTKDDDEVDEEGSDGEAEVAERGEKRRVESTSGGGGKGGKEETRGEEAEEQGPRGGTFEKNRREGHYSINSGTHHITSHVQHIQNTKPGPVLISSQSPVRRITHPRTNPLPLSLFPLSTFQVQGQQKNEENHPYCEITPKIRLSCSGFSRVLN